MNKLQERNTVAINVSAQTFAILWGRIKKAIPKLVLDNYLEPIIRTGFLDYTALDTLESHIKKTGITEDDLDVDVDIAISNIIINFKYKDQKRTFLMIPIEPHLLDINNIKSYLVNEFELVMAYFYESGDYEKYKRLCKIRKLVKNFKENEESEKEYWSLQVKNRAIKIYKKVRLNTI